MCVSRSIGRASGADVGTGVTVSYEISVGPAQLTINIGECVLIAEPDGQIHQPSERGLFFRDTRLISAWSIMADGRPWQLLSSAATAHFAAQVVLSNRPLPKDDGDIPMGSVSLTLSRLLGHGGLRESIVVRNYNRRAIEFALTIQIACDFADIFDVKSNRLVGRGRSDTRWNAEEGRIETVHGNKTFRRGISIAAVDGCPKPRLLNGALCFTVTANPQSAWQTELAYQILDADTVLQAPEAGFARRSTSAEAADLVAWRAQALRLETPHVGLQRLFDQALDDLSALRLPSPDLDRETFVPAAGIPWFAALFGRDSLVTAIQATPVFPRFARGALRLLARHQADGFDDSRDMQPGKIPHELRRGELSELGLVPHRPYYGTADATPLYVILLHEAWQHSGDRSLLDEHIGTADRCLDWVDRYGDLDGDGFQEYRRLAPDGADNQGWKDSGNGVLDETGDDVPAPKALCELQGYVYDAWLRMAAMCDALERPQDADRFRSKARDLYRRFNDVFWDDEQQFYALCLDPDKRRVMTIASNPGHLLASGIVPPERAAAVARRLLADDMWSGWGIRTLSSEHPAYNPHDYQLGSVWPHDNGIIALGLARYGFRTEAAQIVQGMVEAGSRFLLNRLPEVFAGTSRADSPFPVQYLGANVPQAWAAASVFTLLHAMLGLAVDAEKSLLYADPVLPDWLPELRIFDLTLAKKPVDLWIRRDGAETKIDITRGVHLRLERRRFGHSVSPDGVP